jgi:phosphate-selective porin OprO/OprP
MNLSRKLLAAAVLVALSSPAFAEIEFDVIGGSEVSFEGLVQADGYWYQDDIASLAGAGSSFGDGTDTDFEMRRAELVLKGKGPGMWGWVIGYDARANKWLDVNVQYKFNGTTFVRVGQFKQPNSLEELSSTKNNDFIAKAMTTNLQGLSRRTGIAVGTGGANWTATASAFTRELTRNAANGNGYGLRGTWAPILESGNYLHLGASLVDYEARDAGSAVGSTPVFDGDNRARFRVRPDADRTAAYLVDSGQFTDAERIRTAGAELAWVHGQFKAQSEYMRTNVSRSAHDDYGFDSWYVSAVWNLTGETWSYKEGVVSTPLPSDPIKGMWQLAARYDHVDLNDGSVDFSTPTPTVSGVMGGKESNWTLGVNWYWRSNFKFALNYVKVQSEKYIAKTSSTYSQDSSWNSKTVNDFLKDDPSIVEFRAQLYW